VAKGDQATKDDKGHQAKADNKCFLAPASTAHNPKCDRQYAEFKCEEQFGEKQTQCWNHKCPYQCMVKWQGTVKISCATAKKKAKSVCTHQVSASTESVCASIKDIQAQEMKSCRSIQSSDACKTAEAEMKRLCKDLHHIEIADMCESMGGQHAVEVKKCEEAESILKKTKSATAQRRSKPSDGKHCTVCSHVSCEACKAKVSEEEYCKKYPDTRGCDTRKQSSQGPAPEKCNEQKGMIAGCTHILTEQQLRKKQEEYDKKATQKIVLRPIQTSATVKSVIMLKPALKSISKKTLIGILDMAKSWNDKYKQEANKQLDDVKVTSLIEVERKGQISGVDISDDGDLDNLDQRLSTNFFNSLGCINESGERGRCKIKFFNNQGKGNRRLSINLGFEIKFSEQTNRTSDEQLSQFIDTDLMLMCEEGLDCSAGSGVVEDEDASRISINNDLEGNADGSKNATAVLQSIFDSSEQEVQQDIAASTDLIEDDMFMSFEVESSSSTVVVEEEESSQVQPKQEVKATYDPVLVIGISVLCGIVVVIGFTVCIVVMVATRKNKAKGKIAVKTVSVAPARDPEAGNMNTKKAWGAEPRATNAY